MVVGFGVGCFVGLLGVVEIVVVRKLELQLCNPVVLMRQLLLERRLERIVLHEWLLGLLCRRSTGFGKVVLIVPRAEDHFN